MTDEEKNSIELDIEAKYVRRKEKEFLNSITYAECLYILDTKNNYCDDIKNLSLLKIVDIIEKQSKEIEELKDTRSIFNMGRRSYKNEIEDKIKEKIKDYKKQIEELKNSQIFTRTEYEGAIKFGQSLLEKKFPTTITKEELEKGWKE